MEKVYLPNEILSERVILKRHSTDLASQMFQYVDKDRARLRKFLPWVDTTKTLEDELNYIKFANDQWDKHLLFDYGIYRKSDILYMGNCGVHTISWSHNRCELGYWILGDFEGQGYMSESVQALEKVLFEVGFNRVEIRCDPANLRSARVPQKNNYQFEGILKQNFIHDDRYVDTKVFAKLKSEWS